ncbi:MAG: CHAT domain-containing protein, partial [Desulfobacterales bacterium]|nr:CHAT domain-containing protein [Desulfobacterales bacterium]
SISLSLEKEAEAIVNTGKDDNTYRKLLADYSNAKKTSSPFFDAKGCELIDVMENLPEGGSLARLFKVIDKNSKYIVFYVNKDGIDTKIINNLNEFKVQKGNNHYIAYENPLELKNAGINSSVLSGTHFVRGVSNRKPFKYDLVMKDKAKPDSIYPLIKNTPNLGLSIFPYNGLKDGYIFGHLLTLYGCPTIIMNTKGNAADLAFVDKFLNNYKTETAFDALQKSDSVKGEWTLLGYNGMTQDESQKFAGAQFESYAQNAQKFFDEKNYLSALPFFEDCILIAKTSESFSKHLSTLYKYARETAYNADDFSKAFKYAKDLADLLTKESADTEEHAEALLRVGLISAQMENYPSSIPAIEKSVEMLKNLELGEKEIDAMTSLGVVLETSTEYSRALKLFNSAVTIGESLNQKEIVAKQYQNIGRIYDLRLSEYSIAMQNYQKALSIYNELGKKPDIAKSLLDIGRCYRLLGNFIEASNNYRSALEIVQKNNLNPEIRAKILIEQANCAWFQAKYEEAFKLQREVYKIAQDENLPLLKIISLNTSGLIFWTLGDNQRALNELEKALELSKSLKEREDEKATTLNNIGLIYREMGDYAKAMYNFEEAYKIDLKLKSRWAIGYDLRNKGLTLIYMGKAEESIPLFEKAILESGAIGNKINEAKSYLGLGDACFELNDNKRAEDSYKKAKELSESMSMRDTLWRAIYGIAKIKLRAKDTLKAKEMLFDAADVIENMRSEIKIDQLKDSFIDNKLSVYETLVTLLADTKENILAFEVSERSRSRNFIDLLGNQRLSLKDSIDQDLYDKQLKLKAFIYEKETILAQSSNESERKVYTKDLERLNLDFKNLMLEIQTKNPALSSIVSVDPISFQKLKDIIDKDIALICYYVMPKETFCFVIKDNNLKLHRIPVDRDTLGKLILTYRRMIQNLEPLDNESTKLFDLFISPVLPDIEGAKTVGIIPHGTLHYLSFASLSNQNEFFIDRFSLFYLPSASLLKYTLDKRTSNKNLNVLAVGNPDLGDPVLSLPFSEHEVNSIKWNFPKITILTKEKANKDWIVDNVEKFGIIHIASHGEFDTINPLFSAIRLAGTSNNNLGKLEASEIFGLKINADMVVLSACQTGLSKVTKGDDVIGLNTAFFYAGTHTMISSLWRVSDISTALLIKQFYREYMNYNKAESLRRAILHVKKRFPHPGYFGAFTLVGDYY